MAGDRRRCRPCPFKISGSIACPGSPLAPTKEKPQKIAGAWPDIEKSRAVLRRLLKAAGQENLSFEVLSTSWLSAPECA
jgi:hypothetical protein